MTPRALKRLCTLENLASTENLLAASHRAMKGKRYRPDVQAWAMRGEAEVLANKRRYVLKCDVRKFFESIDHEILLSRLFKVVHCPGVRRVLRLIVESNATQSGPHSPLCGAPSVLATSKPAQKTVRTTMGLPLGNLTSQLWANFDLDGFDHWITETMRFGAYARYTDDFLIFANDKAALHELHTGIVKQLASLRLELAENKTRLMTTSEGVPFCGFVFRPGLCPRVLGATKRRFEQRRTHLARARHLFTLSQVIVSWYSFSREGNATGLHRAYTRWSLRQRHRQKRQRGRTTRVLRGGSWNNNDRGNAQRDSAQSNAERILHGGRSRNLLSSNRHHNTPGNRNNNNGLAFASLRLCGQASPHGMPLRGRAGRCVVVPGGSPKTGPGNGPVGGGSTLPPQRQEVRLTHAPVSWRK